MLWLLLETLLLLKSLLWLLLLKSLLLLEPLLRLLLKSLLLLEALLWLLLESLLLLRLTLLQEASDLVISEALTPQLLDEGLLVLTAGYKRKNTIYVI